MSVRCPLSALVEPRSGSSGWSRPRYALVRIVVVWLVLASCASCTPTDLRLEKLNTSISLQGQFCTEDPSQSVVQTKVLVVAEVSASMATSDPMSARVQLLLQLHDHYREMETIQFGLIRFAAGFGVPTAQVCSYADVPCTTEVSFVESAFTRDEISLQKAANSLKVAQGSAPFAQTLQLVHRVLQSEIELDSVMASQTSYKVIFLADGPACPEEEFEPILEQVRSIRQLADLSLGSLAFHAGLFALHASAEQGCDSTSLGEQLLTSMTGQGGGQVHKFESQDDLSLVPFVQGQVEQMYELVNISVENRNARLMSYQGRVTLVADSDGDGLTDEEEIQLGTSPSSADTDNDGCGDRLEAYKDGFDPLKAGTLSEPAHCFCFAAERTTDTDGDGLTDCEEYFIGTSKRDYDSDGDLLPDGLEHRGGSDPTKFQFGLHDADGDGVLDWDEAWLHRRPDVDEEQLDSDVAAKYEYTYQIEQIGPIQNGVTCYRFEVSNISVLATQGADFPAADVGQNVIDIHFAQRPLNVASQSTLFRTGNFQQFYLDDAGLVPKRDSIPVRQELLKLIR